MRYAAFYGRYSSERQNEQSIEGQLNVCEKYAEQNGLKIVETYIDRAMTGTNDHRPAFQKMLADCEKNVPWEIVLVYAIDRFGRNSIEIAVNKQKLKKNNKMLISATQRTSDNIDGTKNLDGILLENVYIGLAEYYSAELSQKVRRGLHESRQKGYYTGGGIPYGYKVKDKKVIIDEDKAEIIRFIFREYASGKIGREIIKELTEKGILYNGKPFTRSTFYYILNLERYIGIYRHGEEIYTNIYPQIVPTELFNEVQRILKKNKIGSFSREVEFLLKGKIICGYCGKKMNGESGTSYNKSKNYYYKCERKKRKSTDCKKKTVRKDELEKLVTDITFHLLQDPKFISALADEIMSIHEKRLRNQSVLNILTTDKEKAEKALANLIAAVEQGLLTPTTKRRINELEDEIDSINTKILQENCLIDNQLKKEDITTFLTDTIQLEPQLMLESLISKIILFDDKIEIHYNYIKNETPDDTPSEARREFLLDFQSTFFQLSPPRLT